MTLRLGLWLKVGVRDWQNYVPIVPTLRHYTSRDFSSDLVAGLVVGMVTIPQAVAYAFLAGVPPEAGLYACLLPMLLYCFFGSSKQLVVGPVAVAAIMLAATVSDFAPKYSAEYLEVAMIICLQVGVVLLLLRLSRMGGLVNLLSHPVITGFVNAAAILIIISQLPAFTGIGAGDSEQAWNQLVHVLSHLLEADTATLVFGTLALSLLLVFPKLIRRLLAFGGWQVDENHAITRVGPMLVAVLAVLAVAAVGIGNGLDKVGFVPSGLPELRIPRFDPALWLALLPSSFAIALVSYVESYSIGTTIAVRQQTRVNSHQELIALGAANVGAAFTGAYPVAGSFSRSSVNYYAGARTAMSSVFCAVVIVAVLMFLTPLFEYLPNAVLAAIVMVSVVGLMDLRSGPRHWRLHREETITEYATMVTVLLLGVETGLIVGVALAIAFFIRTSSRPNITQVGRMANTEHFRSIKRHDVETLPHVLALRVDENIYFANATQIEDKFLKRAQRRKSTRHLLIVGSSINLIDATGIQMLHRLNDNLQRAGITLNFCDFKEQLVVTLDRAGLLATLNGQQFISADRAMRHFARELETDGDT